MKLKKCLCLIIIVFLFSFSGCTEEDPGLYINPEINAYSPYMSSTPGIGLIASFQRDLKNKNYKFHWVAEEGIFLNWHGNEAGMGRIEVLGNDIKTNVHKVYWSVDGDKKIESSSFKVYLTVEHIETEKVMYEAYIEIFQDEEGFFSIKR